MFWKMALVLLLVGINGFFVAAEFALVKIRMSEVRLLAQSGRRTARALERILKRLDAYLSACQLGITLASLGLGWVGEPLVARTLEPLMEEFGVPASRAHFVAFPIAFALITFLHITAGEQVPKILAIYRYRPTALAVSLPLALFYMVFRPFIWLLNTSSNAMLRSIGIRLEGEHGVPPTEEQLRLLLAESAEGGHVSSHEHTLMENVLDLEEKVARRYMVPRSQIVYIDKNDSIEEKLRKARESGHTRLPLCDDDLDHIIGIVHIKDVFGALASHEKLTALADLARKPTFVPERITLYDLLCEFQKTQMPLAVLVDEYGVVSGMITLDDVLEEVVGPMLDEFDTHAPLVTETGPNRFEVDAVCPVDKVVEVCAIELPDTEADTIGGVVTDLLGHIPNPGEDVRVGRHKITVLDAEPTRVLRVLIEEEESADPEMSEDMQ